MLCSSRPLGRPKTRCRTPSTPHLAGVGSPRTLSNPTTRTRERINRRLWTPQTRNREYLPAKAFRRFPPTRTEFRAARRENNPRTRPSTNQLGATCTMLLRWTTNNRTRKIKMVIIRAQATTKETQPLAPSKLPRCPTREDKTVEAPTKTVNQGQKPSFTPLNPTIWWLVPNLNSQCSRIQRHQTRNLALSNHLQPIRTQV